MKIEPINGNSRKDSYIRYPIQNKTYKQTYDPETGKNTLTEVDIGINTPLEVNSLTEMYNYVEKDGQSS